MFPHSLRLKSNFSLREFTSLTGVFLTNKICLFFCFPIDLIIKEHFFFSLFNVRPDLFDSALDSQTGLSMVSLPIPGDMLDKTQAKLTQRILDTLGEGLEVGVSGNLVYGRRRGDTKVFWSFSKFDSSRIPQEVSKLNPDALFLWKNFIQGELKRKRCHVCGSLCLIIGSCRNNRLQLWGGLPPVLLVLLSGGEVARPRKQTVDEETNHN